jgi:hypothetical protein
MSNRLLFTAAIVLLVCAGFSPAQPSTAGQREAMKKLEFLVGSWKGEGWMEFIPGQRRTFKGVEIAQLRLDGLILTIDGMHRGQVGGKGEEVVVHNAFALVNYDEKAKRYRFQGFTARGNHEDAEAKVTDGQLVWGMKIPQFGDVRYTIKLDNKGRWFEVGEVTLDGKEWRRFFEMTLDRVEAK